MQRAKDLETLWRTGKSPASGYTEEDDPAFASSGGDAGSDNDTDLQNGDDTGSDQPLPADDPSIVYMGPDQGPFECQNCIYFVGDGQPCQKVSDPVQAEGCCNQYQCAGNETQQQEHSEGMEGAGAGSSGALPPGNFAGL